MHELPRRLLSSPRLAAELYLATFCINLLALADTIYVMILLRRYIAYGFDGTLLLLTAGALVAVGLQLGFMAARRTLAARVGAGEDERLAGRVHRALVGSQLVALDAVPVETVRQSTADLAEIQSSCDADAVCALLDAPFSLMFAAAAWFLSPLLAAIVLVGIAASVLTGWLGARGGSSRARTFQKAAAQGRSVLASVTAFGDTVRLFRGREFCRRRFLAAQDKAAALRRGTEDARGLSQAVTMGVGVFVRVGLYAVGAKLVVDGRLTVAALIGVSILGSYAIAKASGSVRAGAAMAGAARARAHLDAVLDLPREREGGQRPQGFEGGVGLSGVACSYGGEALFSGLDLTLSSGGVLAVRGYNGSGKTTLLRLLAGLLEPTEGRVEVDGRPLAELDPAWWRENLAVMPQEPFFLAGTIRENILMGTADDGGEGTDSSAALRSLVRRAGLREFLDTSEKGVETPVVDAGRTLPVGIRKRLALARALASPGRLALLDEPTAGMDAEGARAVYEAMNAMVREGRTIVVVSGDPNIVKGAKVVLDLGVKPVPSLITAGESRGEAQ